MEGLLDIIRGEALRCKVFHMGGNLFPFMKTMCLFSSGNGFFWTLVLSFLAYSERLFIRLTFPKIDRGRKTVAKYESIPSTTAATSCFASILTTRTLLPDAAC